MRLVLGSRGQRHRLVPPAYGCKVPTQDAPSCEERGKASLFSLEYMTLAVPICRTLHRHLVVHALCLAFAKAGKSIDAKSAMIATTTKSSISVKPRRLGFIF